MNDVNSLSHSKWRCKYHIVFAMVFSITHLESTVECAEFFSNRDIISAFMGN